MIALGTVRPGSTIEIPFETFAGSTGAPITMTGLVTTGSPPTCIKVYKDGSTTERASASGYALLDTDGIDFDGLTGIHGFTIDLSDNSTADFWASGSRYTVVVTALTVDSQTVRFVAATFRIGYVGALLDTTIATLSSQTLFTLSAGSADDDAYNGCTLICHDAASGVQMCLGVVADYTGSTKAVALAVDPGVFTMAAKDNIAILPRALQATVPGRTLDVSTGGEAGVDWANVGTPGSTVGLSGTTVATVTTTTTATNLTNAPTNGDLTATMKTSVTTAATAATPTAAAVTGNVGGNVVGSVGSLGAQAKLDVNAEVDTAISDAALATAANLATVDGVADAIKVVTDKLDTALELDVAVYRFTTNALEQAPSGGGGGTDWTADEKTAIKTILGVPASGTTPDAPAAGALKVIDDFLDTEVAAIKAKTDNLPASPAATGDIPSAAAIRSEMDTNSTKLSDILTDTAVIGAAGAGLTAVPWNASWDAEVQSEVADALVAYDPPTKAELDAAVAPLATSAGVSAVETDTQDIQGRLPATLTGAGNIKADAQVVSDKTGYALTTAPLDAAGTRTAIGLASANLDTQISAVAASATTAATQSTAAASSASTAATQATNAAADALQTKKVMEAMPILDTSTTPWSLKLIQQGTGTSGANYLDGTVLRTLYLYTAAGVAVTAATQVVGSQRDS